MRFESDLWVPRPRDVVFAFFANAANLETITPPWLHFRILDPGLAIRAGTLIDYRLRLHGIPLTWQSEISRWDPPNSFVDEQRKGPYRRWVHTHTFADERGGTRVSDAVEFEAPFGWLVGGFVMRDVKKIFAFRAQALLTLFPPAPPSAT
jgi:ligand-binding SRPBCC domain-containing protein